MSYKFLVGYRWVASGGAKICERCTAMNDRSFYLNPKPGQLRYPDDIPRCRC